MTRTRVYTQVCNQLIDKYFLSRTTYAIRNVLRLKKCLSEQLKQLKELLFQPRWTCVYTIDDQKGDLVYRTRHYQAAINPDPLAPGSYVVKVQTATTAWTSKLLVE